MFASVVAQTTVVTRQLPCELDFVNDRLHGVYRAICDTISASSSIMIQSYVAASVVARVTAAV